MVVKFPNSHRNLIHDNNLIEILMNSYLFKVADINDNSECICFTPQSRAAGFQLLHSIAKIDNTGEHRSLEKIFLHVKEFTDSVDLWDGNKMNNESEVWRKNECGYVGLRNQGNTCYLNATIQQIFMIKSLRRGLLSFNTPEPPIPTKDEDGLEIQVIDNMATMRELQKSLTYLLEGTFAGHNPKALVDTCLNLGLSENIYSQNCAAEFMMKFLDRLENMTKGTVHEKLMKFHFSGKLANQTIRYSDESVTNFTFKYC
jgi:uncharacterized UBP type Zn finger protein